LRIDIVIRYKFIHTSRYFWGCLVFGYTLEKAAREWNGYQQQQQHHQQYIHTSDGHSSINWKCWERDEAGEWENNFHISIHTYVHIYMFVALNRLPFLPCIFLSKLLVNFLHWTMNEKDRSVMFSLSHSHSLLLTTTSYMCWTSIRKMCIYVYLKSEVGARVRKWDVCEERVKCWIYCVCFFSNEWKFSVAILTLGKTRSSLK
jgi:hypothetical protein